VAKHQFRLTGYEKKEEEEEKTDCLEKKFLPVLSA
jgi:hypothetical protein